MKAASYAQARENNLLEPPLPRNQSHSKITIAKRIKKLRINYCFIIFKTSLLLSFIK